MKKENIINLVKYHVENNNSAFINETCDIAKDFEKTGDSSISEYLYELISNSNVYVPQTANHNYKYLTKKEYTNKPLYLPNSIEEDVIGITKAIKRNIGMQKFLFFGAPGTGKTESAYLIARILNYDMYMVNIEQLIDSKLGETSKNVVEMFEEINKLPILNSIVIFDELDSLISNRIANNDLKEMGRVTTAFLKCFDNLKNGAVIIATTNLINCFDKALIRRFDANISFDRYTKEDLIEISNMFLSQILKKTDNTKQNKKMFSKIIKNCKNVPYPGELKQIIRTAVAFSDENSEYDYLRKFYLGINQISNIPNINELASQGYTSREIEILTKVSKSSVNRKISRGIK